MFRIQFTKKMILFALICCMGSLSFIVNGQCPLILNSGKSGNNTADLLLRMEKDVLSVRPDIVLLMVGTNDMLNSSKMLSYDTYLENLKQIIGKLGNTKIVLVSPPTVDDLYLYERHERSLYAQKPNLKLDSIGRLMEALSKSSPNIGFVDIHRVFGEKNLPRHDQDLYIQNEFNSKKRDGVHSTPKGHRLIAKIIFRFLKKGNWLKRDSVIVCFGDSITYGKNVEGEGTSNGKTYPAYLSGWACNLKF